jgi:hypothetical protein
MLYTSRLIIEDDTEYTPDGVKSIVKVVTKQPVFERD